MVTDHADIALLGLLDDCYGVMRRVQGDHNTSVHTKKTRCIGSGNCCNVGLAIPLLECHNIAKNLRREYWMIYEQSGQEDADGWYAQILKKLKAAFTDPKWRIDNETTGRKCAFWQTGVGCSIYDYRPFICRAYGTILPVDESCPRGRTENGEVVIFLGNEIDKIIQRFESILKAYNEAHPEAAYSVYMPLGVLRFLLPETDFREFMGGLDARFTQANSGYPHQMWKAREEAKGEQTN